MFSLKGGNVQVAMVIWVSRESSDCFLLSLPNLAILYERCRVPQKCSDLTIEWRWSVIMSGKLHYKYNCSVLIKVYFFKTKRTFLWQLS